MNAKTAQLNVRVDPAARKALNVMAAMSDESVQELITDALRVAFGCGSDETAKRLRHTYSAYRSVSKDDVSFDLPLTPLGAQRQSERMNGIVGVVGSIPTGSTSPKHGDCKGTVSKDRTFLPFR